MSFSYIKMFFFLSLAIVFLFILLMCYYLKNKIEIVERRVSSQTDVLGKLIREFKLQACFGYGGAGGGSESIQGQQGVRLEPLLEQDDDTESDDETDYIEEADTDDDADSDVGMEKVKDNDLLDIDETVKVSEEEDTELEEYKDLDFEKVANEDNDVPLSIAEKEPEEKIPVEPQVVLEDAQSLAKAEPKQQVVLGDEAEAKAEPEFDDELQEKEAKTEDYHKMSLVQLKHVAQHTFHLSTTQIAKMKKDDLLKWILAQ